MVQEALNRAGSVDRPVAERGVQQERLSKWLGFSFVVHGILIGVVFVVPSLPTRTPPQYPVYSVELVGGEKIGGVRFGTEVAPQRTKQVSKRADPELAVPVAKAKAEAKKEKPQKAKPVEKTPPPEEPPVAAEKPRSEPEKPEVAMKTKEAEKAPPPEEAPVVAEKPRNEPENPQLAKEAKAESGDDALERVRERLIQSAVERIKSRAESTQKAAIAASTASVTNKGGEVLSSGPGEGDGAAALGAGGRGGGIVRGIEFIAYQAKLFETIRANWSWVGHRGDLRVVVRFGIKENGDIVGLRVVQPSGDSSYDDSVLRALRKSSPLPAPPEDYRKDFSNVELAFRPKDLGA